MRQTPPLTVWLNRREYATVPVSEWIRMWRFIQISDPHLGSQLDGVWNNGFICSMMPDVMRCLKRDLEDLELDFILVTGDIASQRSCESVFAARDLIERVPPALSRVSDPVGRLLHEPPGRYLR